MKRWREWAVQVVAWTACLILRSSTEDLAMLPRSSLVAFMQAASLSERQPVETTTRGSIRTTAELWAGKAITDQGMLAEFLVAQSLGEGELEALLNGRAWKPRPGSMSWIQHIEPFLLPEASPLVCSAPVVVENTWLRDTPFPALIDPIVYAQGSFLDQWPWVTPGARASLLTYLREQAATLALRSLLEELAGQGDYAALDASFSRREFRLRFFARYPVLACDLVTCVQSWRCMVGQMLTRLADDACELGLTGLLPGSIFAVRSVEFSGDRHSGGQTVAILTFEDGHRLVYKPRDCNIFALYRDFLGIIAPEMHIEARLYVPKFLIRPGYGWIEFIHHAPASVAPRSHLRKLGTLLAVAYVLGASDLHLENVIASARGPILVDLETLVQNRSRSGSRSTAAALAASWLNASVLGSGILPVRLAVGESASIDISVATGGLHADEAHTVAVHQIVDPFTDRMRIESIEVPVGRSKNQPAGMTADLIREHRAVLAEGFTETCRAIMKKRSQLVAFLGSAPNLIHRYIARATRSYSLLLTEFRQPSRLRSGLARDDLLRRLWVRLVDNLEEAPLIHAEEQSLRRLDVPLFSSAFDSRSLYVDGHEVLSNYFARTARDDAISRITALNESSIKDSTRLISESILAATPTSTRRHQHEESGRGCPGNLISIFRDVGREQAEILMETAILGDDDATWISVASSTDGSGLEYRPLGPTLYDGLAGITFATSYAHRVYPNLGFDDLARRTAQALSDIVSDWIEARLTLPIGAFSGAAGLLYALSHYDREFDGNRYSRLREAALHCLRDFVSSDTYFDIMAGAAGAIAVITAEPFMTTNSYEKKATLRVLADHLLENATRIDSATLTWETGQSRARLGGFSHGATGIGWALARAASVLDDDVVARAARQALHFDDTLFDPQENRWLDARPESLAQGRLYPVHWCHGAAGIAMARASAAGILNDETLLEYARDGTLATISRPLPTDDSLCHGTLGNLLSIEAGWCRLATSVELSSYRDMLAERFTRCVPRVGMPEGVTTVRGLMLGTAGIVYALSKQIDPSIPNVMILE